MTADPFERNIPVKFGVRRFSFIDQMRAELSVFNLFQCMAHRQFIGKNSFGLPARYEQESRKKGSDVFQGSNVLNEEGFSRALFLFYRNAP